MEFIVNNMKKKIIVILLFIILLGTFWKIYHNYIEPFEYAQKITGLQIPLTSEYIIKKWEVNDFDAGTTIDMVFDISNSDINLIQKQCIELKYIRFNKLNNVLYERKISKRNSFSHTIVSIN